MKNSFAIHSVLAAVLVVPAVTLETQHPTSLEQSLLRTLRALESLAGIQEVVQAEAPGAIDTILEWTEAPISADGTQERLLLELRDDVQRLQNELDLTQPSAHEAIGELDYPEPDRSLPLPPTTGLDESTRQLLAAIQPARAPASVGSGAAAKEQVRPDGAVPFEPDGYTADALRLARVHYKQARYAEALDVLAAEQGAEATYWRARCFERLERFDEALAAYRAVMADPQAGSAAQRAKEDSEFLEWRLSFERSEQEKSERPR